MRRRLGWRYGQIRPGSFALLGFAALALAGVAVRLGAYLFAFEVGAAKQACERRPRAESGQPPVEAGEMNRSRARWSVSASIIDALHVDDDRTGRNQPHVFDGVAAAQKIERVGKSRPGGAGDCSRLHCRHYAVMEIPARLVDVDRGRLFAGAVVRRSSWPKSASGALRRYFAPFGPSEREATGGRLHTDLTGFDIDVAHPEGAVVQCVRRTRHGCAYSRRNST